MYVPVFIFLGRAVWGKTGLASSLQDEPDWDLNGHGTHCAGTVGGLRYGIAKKVTLIACKLLNSAGSGQVSGNLEYTVLDINTSTCI